VFLRNSSGWITGGIPGIQPFPSRNPGLQQEQQEPPHISKLKNKLHLLELNPAAPTQYQTQQHSNHLTSRPFLNACILVMILPPSLVSSLPSTQLCQQCQLITPPPLTTLPPPSLLTITTATATTKPPPQKTPQPAANEPIGCNVGPNC